MKKLASMIFFGVLAVCTLNFASSYETSATVVPTGLENQYLFNVKIEKVSQDSEERELLMAPSLVCVAGETAEVSLNTEEENAFSAITLKAFVPKAEEDQVAQAAELSVFITDENNEVLSSNMTITIEDHVASEIQALEPEATL